MAIIGRSKRVITYHGRSGRPIIHVADNGRRYIMVRHPSGKGVKRLYEGSYYYENGSRKKLKFITIGEAYNEQNDIRDLMREHGIKRQIS